MIMRLLIVTQAVDMNHSSLGFFHGWIAEFSKHFDTVQVICLEEGAHALPANVTVMSLGKTAGDRTGFFDRIRYAACFFRLLRESRGTYDVVLVHMNQEYVLLGGWYWRLKGIPIFLWRNHYAGSILTNIAVAFCTKVFCTSRHSYTARFKKTTRMPVGVDITHAPNGDIVRAPRSILSLGRISPSKNIHVIVEALGRLHAQGIDFTATIQGMTAPEDMSYLARLQTRVQELEMGQRVIFKEAVPESKTYDIYRAHEIFINASPSGMLDKTIFSASAEGCLVLASSKDFAEQADKSCVFEEGNVASLAENMTALLSITEDVHTVLSAKLRKSAEVNSLDALGGRLAEEMKNSYTAAHESPRD